MNQIKKIDELLSNDTKLQKYLLELEKENVEIPNDLNENINIKIKSKKKKYLINICKIAACLIFSLAVCRTDFIKNDQFNTKEYKNTKENTKVEQKISDFCKILTTPLNLGGKD